MISDRPICVAGAGSIGCFVGGMYAAAGRSVALLARPRVIAEIEGHGLRLSGFDGFERRIEAARLTLSENPSIFNDAGAVLVAVKSADTAAIADLVARHAPRDTVIISLQNGVGNVPVLRQRLPGRRVLAGMVAFNVVSRGEGRFHRATSGDIVIEQDEAETAHALSVPGLKLRASPDIAGVQWGKLVVNLNNALNALSDLPLRQQLAQRACDAIFAALLASVMKVDPQARSSMWEDLQRDRRTEIDYLQGVIIAIAERHGLQVPLSRRVLALVKAAEAAGKGSPKLTPEQIRFPSALQTQEPARIGQRPGR